MPANRGFGNVGLYQTCLSTKIEGLFITYRNLLGLKHNTYPSPKTQSHEKSQEGESWDWLRIGPKQGPF